MIKNKPMNTEKKLTAMQEFIDRLKNDFGFVVSNNVTEMYLEKEKQQIVDAAKHGVNFENSPFKNAEEYYKETYKKDNELDCPFDFTSRCTLGRCDCKPKKNN